MYDARAALRAANEYPFRPEAVKSIIHIDSSPVNYSSFDKYKVIIVINAFWQTLIQFHIISGVGEVLREIWKNVSHTKYAKILKKKKMEI